MKVLIFYRQNDETHRAVDEFVRDFSKQYPDAPLTLIEADSVEGSEQAQIYDIMQYPTVIAAADDGSTLQRWDSGIMPLMNEVSYYANQ